MMGSKGLGKERPSKGSSEKVGLKDPKVLGKGCIGSETSGPGAYQSMLGSEDLAYS